MSSVEVETKLTAKCLTLFDEDKFNISKHRWFASAMNLVRDFPELLGLVPMSLFSILACTDCA